MNLTWRCDTYPIDAIGRSCFIRQDTDGPCINPRIDLEELPPSGRIFFGYRIVGEWAAELGWVRGSFLEAAQAENRMLREALKMCNARIGELEGVIASLRQLDSRGPNAVDMLAQLFPAGDRGE